MSILSYFPLFKQHTIHMDKFLKRNQNSSVPGIDVNKKEFLDRLNPNDLSLWVSQISQNIASFFCYLYACCESRWLKIRFEKMFYELHNEGCERWTGTREKIHSIKIIRRFWTALCMYHANRKIAVSAVKLWACSFIAPPSPSPCACIVSVYEQQMQLLKLSECEMNWPDDPLTNVRYIGIPLLFNWCWHTS